MSREVVQSTLSNGVCVCLEYLCQRQHDPDENVRTDVIQSIVGALKKEFSVASDDLLNCIKERTLDKKVS